MRVRFTPRALRQFSSIAEFIAKDDAIAARRIGERIWSVCGLLANVPGIGRAGALAGTREMRVPGLP
jgi:plasmid stabilization system protein ParE